MNERQARGLVYIGILAVSASTVVSWALLGAATGLWVASIVLSVC